MTFSAQVVPGQKLGRQLGYPTANLSPLPNSKQLERGVYRCQVKLATGQTYLGAIYFGPKKVDQSWQDTWEVHLLDFDGDIYNQKIIIELDPKKDFIRPPVKFSSLDHLKQQLAEDITQVRL